MMGSRQLRGRAAARLSTLVMMAMLAPAGLAAAPDTTAMNQPRKPFLIHGNTYYVGTAGITSLLIVSEFGHVLVDAGLPESAPLIARSIEALGYKLTDVKGIVFSHAHGDHVGGLAELQRLTGAQIYALRPAHEVILSGRLPRDDPFFGAKGVTPIPKVERAWVATDGQLLGIGSLRLRVHATPGHTPGSATWTWEACEGSKCLDFVYADALSAASADKYRFKDHPETLAGFENSFKLLESIPCSFLISPHPDAATLDRLEQAKGNYESLRDEMACKRYAQEQRAALQQRLAGEG